MRIALVSREVSPFFGAGIGSYAAAMARAWRASGHEVHIVSAPHSGFVDRGPGALGGATCHAITPDLAAEFEASYPFMRHAMGAYRLLLRLHAATPFDYIEFPDYWAEGCFAIRAKRTLGEFESAVLGVRLHTPTHECRRLNDEAWLDDEVAALEHCEEAAVREADVVISPTRSLLDILSRRLELSNPRFVVPYPFEAPTPPAATAASRRTILYFGRLERRKGVQLLIAAAQKLLDRGLDFDTRLIGGDTHTGPSATSMKAHLRALIDPKWAGRIHLDNPVPRHELPAIIAAVRDGGGACCFPSLWENFPNTCLEAMSLGCPVIGSDAGGMGEIIIPGLSGQLFRSGDAGSLADAIERVLGDAPLRAAIGGSGPGRIASLCEPEAVVDQMIAAIRGVPAAMPIRLPAPASPAASIIIPFYNLSRFLPETLASVQAQTRRDFEVIIVDDGSTEPEAPALLQRIESGEFGTVRIIRQRNGGLAAARNAGIAEARAPWVVPLDADDLLEPRFIERTLAAAARDPGLGMVATIVTYFHDDDSTSRGTWVPLGLDRDILSTTNCASTCTALIRRDVLNELGGYDTSLRSFEDWDLYCRMALHGCRATVIPESLVRYRMRSDSMMREIGEPRLAAYQSQLLARYPRLALHPDRAMRIIASRAHGLSAESRAREIIGENIRYRLADKVNIALKRTGVQKAVKGLASRVLGKREETK